MSRKEVRRENTKLDHLFYRPEDAKDFYYEDIDEVTQFNELEEGVVVDETPSEDELPFPTEITIVDQIIYKDFSGKDVVDVIIEVDDVDSVKTYNIRLAKMPTAP